MKKSLFVLAILVVAMVGAAYAKNECTEGDIKCAPGNKLQRCESNKWVDQTNLPCDGPDSDKCTEGTYSCVSNTPTCSDNTGNNVETCDGIDNDCNAATADGSSESWLGTSCDGADSDLCDEGTFSCSAGAKTCSDTTGNNLEVCNNADDNCDEIVDNGIANIYTGSDVGECKQGIQSCVDGQMIFTQTEVTPVSEICDDNLDNDCDGVVNNGCSDPSIPEFSYLTALLGLALVAGLYAIIIRK